MGGGKKHNLSSYNYLPEKLHFLPLNLIIQICCIWKIQWSLFFKINSIHTRQSSLYFFTVKIKIFKHIYMQKNIKVEQFVEIIHYKKVDGPWWVKLK